MKTAVEPKIDDENNSANIIQTYISTNQISDNPTLENNGVFEHDTHDGGGDVINVIGETTVIENHTSISMADENTFKKPFDAPQPQPATSQRPPANNSDNPNAVGKPTREIISCFMTTGGFISPAREGKLPEAKKPIVIQEDPEPEEVRIKQRTPSPEVVERKHHSNKRDRETKNDQSETSKNYGNDAIKHNDSAYADDEEGKEVKLYEVIQTVPDPPPKKKTKKSQLGIAQLKQQKKLKKINQLKANRNLLKMGTDNASHSFSDNFVKNPMLSAELVVNEKSKKKQHKLEALKKKHKQKQLNAAAFGNNPELSEKQHKKRMSRLSKKNLQAMGLNPNAIEGFAIPSSTDPTNYSMHDSNALDIHPKENLTKKSMKQLQKLSNEPDKQKIKFFKKLSSTSSNLLSKMNESRDHEMDRMMTNLSGNDLNHQIADHGFNSGDGFEGLAGQIGHFVPGMADSNRLPPNLDDLPPSKKQKLLKKLNKPPKEPKIPKIKKVKKDPLAKKEKKTPKMLDSPAGLPKQPLNMDENPMSKMFLPDKFRPDVGMIDQFPVPGINPLNPLFQSVRFDLPVRDQMQNFQFPGSLQNFDFANFSRFKRPNFSDSVQSEIENMGKFPRDISNPPSKPLCNVAPLMPPSLLNMEMHNQKDDYMNAPMNEPHSSQKHYQEPPHSGLGSKKNHPFNNPSGQYSDQPFGGNDSPIVINSDEDDKLRSNPSQSPGLEPDTSFGGGEVKRKKVKDKKDKEKKEKKEKDTGVVKMKKKKDKKDKSKNKGDHSKPPKDKAALKEEKRKKKKERERSAAALSMDTNDSMGTASNPFYGSQSHSEWPRDSFSKEPDHSQLGDSSDVNATFNTDNSNLETNAIPKLTLKLAPSSSSPSSRTSRPSTPDFPINKKR